MEQNFDPRVDEAVRHFGRHLVALSYASQLLDKSGEPSSEPDCHFCSGFIIRICHRWWWATAGHILEKIDEVTRTRQAIAKGFRLIDHFGTGKDKNYIPFDFAGARKIYEYDEDKGIDFGFVEIRKHDRKLLEANDVTAILKKEWAVQDRLDYDNYFMLGFPTEDRIKTVCEYPDSYSVTGRPIPSAMYLKRIPDPSPARKTASRRFAAELHKNANFDIDGMSGGPIFGFLKGSPKYRVLAIQCSWLLKQRTTFGFLISTAARICERELKAAATK